MTALADALGLAPTERKALLAATGDDGPKRPQDDLLTALSVGTRGRLAWTAQELALVVHTRLRREEELRQIHDPAPLPVRWRPAPVGLVDSWDNISGAEPGQAGQPIPLVDERDRLVPLYRQIPSGRLVVLGPAGSGKTISVTRFALDLLAVRGVDDPVPVIFDISTWIRPRRPCGAGWWTGWNATTPV
ncbi:hypothetical protein LZG04_15675 [Saccharothrix sp. S26]|uniref:hypothetical protein n=1 Tax=Saccharothrix sp. S26 TaxID=2907215 RepID=UPI001F453DA5|nr:hypothetical protein [Saccharothrix sp. S26]MCE6996225.1 hypothetical protein [Saccharothrix sp. S26]